MTEGLIRQEHSDGCGAACLAMLLGISYKEAREILPGHTTMASMRAELAKHDNLPSCKLLLVGDDLQQHWVVVIYGLFFDPALSFVKRKLNKRYAHVLDSIEL